MSNWLNQVKQMSILKNEIQVKDARGGLTIGYTKNIPYETTIRYLVQIRFTSLSPERLPQPHGLGYKFG